MKFHLQTTGIGSLPHHNVDAALEHVCQVDIPYLPQIPIRNPREYMVGQALDGLPGLTNDPSGGTSLDMSVWSTHAAEFGARLETAFRNSKQPDAFRDFEPESSSWAAWNPFLWEMSERKAPVVKIQMAGPLTCQWTLRDQDGKPIPNDVGSQIFQLVLARATAMIRRCRSEGHEVVFFIDEPALYLLDLKSPTHVSGLQELKLSLQALKKEGATTGLHCCSNTHWAPVLTLGADFLSFDALLSLPAILECTRDLETFWAAGGRFALGLVPTNPKSQDMSVDLVWEKFRSLVPASLWPRVLQEALLTPACGMALHTPASAEDLLTRLKALQERARAASPSGARS